MQENIQHNVILVIYWKSTSIFKWANFLWFVIPCSRFKRFVSPGPGWGLRITFFMFSKNVGALTGATNDLLDYLDYAWSHLTRLMFTKHPEVSHLHTRGNYGGHKLSPWMKLSAPELNHIGNNIIEILIQTRTDLWYLSTTRTKVPTLADILCPGGKYGPGRKQTLYIDYHSIISFYLCVWEHNFSQCFDIHTLSFWIQNAWNKHSSLYLSSNAKKPNFLKPNSKPGSHFMFISTCHCVHCS